ncbi:MAG: acyl-CoA dehydrogenase [Alphaproteobacteria bacterium]|nr:acyl-CoA dehydrogenase [Alphaproteobacteria bacterium]
MTPYYTHEHEAFRATLQRFVVEEIEPYVASWEADGEVPLSVFQQSGSIGLRGLGFPEVFGGTPGDPFHQIIVYEELGRAGSGGVVAALTIHGIAAMPIVAYGTEEMKSRVLPGIVSGDKRVALCITEPGAGSDVAGLATRAVRVGRDFVVNGCKTFITGGMNADYYVVAVRTADAGADGISLLLIERETPGLTQSRLDKMGWHASDTATLYFDDCRVPASNLIGPENRGFRAIVKNFNGERFSIAAMAHGMARCAYDEALIYAKERSTFGAPLITRQVIRHKLIDMATRVAALKANLEAVACRLCQGKSIVADVCMLKNFATATIAYCASEAVQIFGGAGYMRGSKVERIFRETKVLAIGGGGEEIMKDLAARQLGW